MKRKNEVAGSELTLQTCLLQGSRTGLGVLSALVSELFSSANYCL